MFWFFRRKGQKGSCFVCADSSPGLTALIPSAVPPAPSMSAPARLLALAASPRLRSAASETPRGQAEAEIPPELPSEPDPDAEAQVQAAAAAADSETEEEKARRLLYCSLCKVAVNSASQLEAHNSGKRRDQPPPQRKYKCPGTDAPPGPPYRYQAQDHAGGQDRGGFHQVLPQAGGQKQTGSLDQIHRSAEQDLLLPDV